VQRVLRDLRRVEFEERAPVFAEKLFDPGETAPAFEFGSHLIEILLMKNRASGLPGFSD
jgi:hypothetical protein